jgi:dihydroxycyclohexadiene carboxylate dehydrogenase
VIAADLETQAGAQAMVSQTLALFGTIDVSVHNVGGTIWARPFWEYSGEQIEKEISRSLWPTLWCCREVIPVMMSRKSGAIVNIGSAVTRGGLYRVPYAAAKGGVHAMTLCMANELAEHGIRVNCVAPGGLDNAGRVIPRNPVPPTDQEKQWISGLYERTLQDTPLGRLGTADEVAAAVCFLAADESSYITGQLISVAGGGTA